MDAIPSKLEASRSVTGISGRPPKKSASGSLSRKQYLPDALVATFGWGVQGAVIVIAVALSFAPWGLTDAELAHTESTEAGERL